MIYNMLTGGSTLSRHLPVPDDQVAKRLLGTERIPHADHDKVTCPARFGHRSECP